MIHKVKNSKQILMIMFFSTAMSAIGLGPKADNISGWKQDLAEWERRVRGR
jgi:hypothetical protein